MNEVVDEFKEWVEYWTGGPNKCQVAVGGTCQRPDIYFANDKHCDPCPYMPHCLCQSRRLRKK